MAVLIIAGMGLGQAEQALAREKLADGRAVGGLDDSLVALGVAGEVLAERCVELQRHLHAPPDAQLGVFVCGPVQPYPGPPWDTAT